MKRGVLILCMFLLSVGFVSSQADNVTISLDKNAYGKQSNFSGILNVTGINPFNLNSVVSYYISGVNGTVVGSDDLTLEEFLGFYLGSYTLVPRSYSVVGNGVTSLQVYRNNKGEKYIGKQLRNTYSSVKDATLSFTGTATHLQVDVGDDNVLEWESKGNRVGWGNVLDVYGAPKYEDYLWDKIDAGTKKCEVINLSFDGAYDELEIMINAKAERTLGVGELKGQVGTSSECSFTNIQSGMGSTSCSVVLKNPSKDKMYSVCVWAEKVGSYNLPSLNSYYFFNIQPGKYDGSFTGSMVLQEEVEEAIEDYISRCLFKDDICVVPVRFNTSKADLMINAFSVQNNIGEFNDRFWELSVVEPRLDARSSFELEKISFLKTPGALGQYFLRFNFDGEDSNKAGFNVSIVPEAVINVDSLYGVVNRPIVFDGSKSKSSGGNITSYTWDFGDNTSSNLSIVSHGYLYEGEYIVRLTVVDSPGIFDTEQVVVKIGKVGEYLEGWINDSITAVNKSLSIYNNKSSAESRIYDLVGYDDLAYYALGNLSLLREEFLSVKNNTLLSNESKELEYIRIAGVMDGLKSMVPSSVRVVDRIGVLNGVVNLIDEIPRTSLSSRYSDVMAYHREIYNYNVRNVKVDANITKVNLTMLDGSVAVKRVVEKYVNAVGASLIAENLNGKGEFQIVYPEPSVVQSGVVEWNIGGGSIIYTLGEGILESVGVTVGFTTNVNVVAPKDYSCGDGVCTIDYEDENNCAVDCEKKVPWVWFILLFVVLLIGALYINFYKGPGNFRSLCNAVSINLFHRRLFTNEKDLENLKNYIGSVLKAGHSEFEIRKVLLERGWTNKQIDYVMRSFK